VDVTDQNQGPTALEVLEQGLSEEADASTTVAAQPSLLSLVEERDRLTETTGRYFGVTELTLKEADPILYERFYSRLSAMMIAAYEVSRYVTASPGSREMGEVLWALLTPEGDSLAISPGFFSHGPASGRICVRWMAEHRYDENPGIRDGDVFVTDDGDAAGSPHPGDTYTYVPIVVGDTLVAWAMGINHIVETGAPQAGSWPTYTADTFSDGFVVPPIKTGENLVQYTWWEQMWLRRTRTGVLNNLDDKMRLSGCAMIHDEIHKLVAEFGLEYHMQAIREVIEETHQAVRDNVRLTSIPGKYDTAGFRVCKYEGLMPLFEHANKDQLIHVRQRLLIDGDGTVAAHMDGTSRWDYHAFNGYPGGADVAFYMAMINCFGYNTKPTSGVVLACWSKYPLGCVYNPGTIHASFSNIWAHSNILNTLGFTSILRSFYSRGFVEEALMVEADWEGIQGEGTLPDGSLYGMVDFTGVGGHAQGAYSFRDGLPLGFAQWTQLPNIGNAEEWEYLLPGSIYIGRGLIPGFCGHGRFRGGDGQGMLMWVLNQGRVTMSRAGSATAYTTFTAQGMSGAFPAPCSVQVSARGTNSVELVKQGVALPRNGLELVKMAEEGILKVDKLETWRFDMPPLQFGEGDMLATHSGASGGWGDPLARDPELALKDVREGWLKPEFVETLYGVVAVEKDGKWTVDEATTQARREELRRERLEQSIPAEDFWRRERDVHLKGGLIEPLKYMYRRFVSEDFDIERELRDFWRLDEGAGEPGEGE
jgi:acetone carboxylase alpha subunit